LREGLKRAGVDVSHVRVPEWRVFRRYPALVLECLRSAGSCDVLFVPEFRHKDVPLAQLMRGRARVVFDPLVSRYDTLVGDWRLHRPNSAQARWNRGIDRWAFTHADLVLCDTWAHGRLFEQLGAPADRLRRILVGAEDAFFAVGPPPPAPPVHIVYLGGFLPLHGVPTVLEAMQQLEARASQLPEFRMTLFGRGIQWEECQKWALDQGLSRVEFPGPVDYADAPRLIQDAHIFLGAFGKGGKAGRVIPHKLYQGLAAGRAVVTGDGEGVREIFTHEEHLLAVPRGDATALAAALERMVCDPELRRTLGAQGRARALVVGSVEQIGRDLAGVLEELCA
jgi:glycosyltransferase involved in cell wall biosynthesis